MAICFVFMPPPGLTVRRSLDCSVETLKLFEPMLCSRVVCSSVRLSVRPSVRLLPNSWTRYFENEWTDLMETGRRGKGVKRLTLRVGSQTVKVIMVEDRFRTLAEASFWGRVAFLDFIHFVVLLRVNSV